MSARKTIFSAIQFLSAAIRLIIHTANKALEHLEQTIKNEWSEELINSWKNAGWWELSQTLGEMIAPVVGAASGQLIVSDSTSLNLYKTVHAALGMSHGRNCIF